jgi:hypothetical protein
LFVLGTAATAANAVVPVSVDFAGAAFTVTIAARTPVRVVLQTLCERAEASCKLPAALPETVVEPRVIRGSWPDVVAELLQGSGLSFGATPAAPQRAPYLFVEARAVAKTAPVRSGAAGIAAAPSEAPIETQPAEVEEVPPEEEAPAAEVAQESATPADPSTATLVTAATAAATPGANFAATPFTDGKGNPLMARLPAPGSPSATPGMSVLPYMDEAGYPMTMPITNEPLSLTPFVGPDGQAWPAPVPQPGQKLEYPIPPNVPPATKPENQ